MKKTLTLIIVILAALGAINWGLVGAFNFNLVTYLFAFNPHLVQIIYIIIGISGVLLLLSIKCFICKSTCSKQLEECIDHNVAKKQHIHSDSSLKSQQHDFIAEGGNSQSLKK